MDVLSAALISFVAVWLLISHIPVKWMHRISDHKGIVDVVLHCSIIYLFFGTSTLGLMQAELCGIFISVYLRLYAYAVANGRRQSNGAA